MRPLGSTNYSATVIRSVEVLTAEGKDEQAIALLNYAQTVDPSNADLCVRKANLLTALGRFAEADSCFQRAVQIVPQHGEAHLGLARVRRFVPDDPRLQVLDAIARNEGLPEKDRAMVHAALTKARIDLGEYGTAIREAKKAAKLQRKLVVYEERATLERFERIRRIFTQHALGEMRGSGHGSPLPVFIVGMPRSGTTLVEQILASHPDVFGGGERFDLWKLEAEVLRLDRAGAKARLTAERLGEIGRRYAEAVQAIAPRASRITDKMPSNFQYVGLVHLALPNARIIHVQRDPVDTCMSCFVTPFRGDALAYTKDLATLGRYYRAYEQLMEHWRTVLPPESMLELQYEEIVADLKGQVRRVLNYCGLEENDACLAFHKTERAVRTSSDVQIRQPLYAEAIGRWRPYQDQIGPLLDALAP